MLLSKMGRLYPWLHGNREGVWGILGNGQIVASGRRPEKWPPLNEKFLSREKPVVVAFSVCDPLTVRAGGKRRGRLAPPCHWAGMDNEGTASRTFPKRSARVSRMARRRAITHDAPPQISRELILRL